MREIRTYGSEGGGAGQPALPTPIFAPKAINPSLHLHSLVPTRRSHGRRSGAPSRAPKKLAKPYLYPTKATARVAPMGVAGEEVLTHPKPGNPPRRISLSVQVRFCQFFLGHFRLRRNRRAAPRLRRGLLFWIRRVPTARADGLGLSPQARQPRRYAAECDHAAQECLAAWRSSPCASSPHSFDFDWPTAI